MTKRVAHNGRLAQLAKELSNIISGVLRVDPPPAAAS